LKTLFGLHILNLNLKSIKINDGAIIEYNRLRSKYREDLTHLVCNTKKNTNFSDQNIYFSRQTAAVIEPSVLKKNIRSKKKVIIKQFYIIYVVWKNQIMLVMQTLLFNAFKN